MRAGAWGERCNEAIAPERCGSKLPNGGWWEGAAERRKVSTAKEKALLWTQDSGTIREILHGTAPCRIRRTLGRMLACMCARRFLKFRVWHICGRYHGASDCLARDGHGPTPRDGDTTALTTEGRTAGPDSSWERNSGQHDQHTPVHWLTI